jgi:hypothetical protein
MYITHTHGCSRIPIGSRYKILYITLYTLCTDVGGRDVAAAAAAAAAAVAAVYPRKTRLPPSDSNTRTYNNNILTGHAGS